MNVLRACNTSSYSRFLIGIRQTFSSIKDKNYDWLEVCYEVGLKIRTIDSAHSKHNMKTRKQLEDMYGDAAVVDEIIRSKTEAGAFVDAPDAPHMLAARLSLRAHVLHMLSSR